MKDNYKNLYREIISSKWTAFLILSSVYLLYSLNKIHAVQDLNRPYFFDAWRYWSLSHLFVDQDGGFSLLNYDTPRRGYLFPLIIYFLNKLAEFLNIESPTLLRFCSSIGTAGLISFIIPTLYEKICRVKIKIIPILIVGFVVFFYWRGFLLYPLTDFPAVITLLLALVIFPWPADNEKFFLGFLRSFLSGVFLGSSIIIRPAFQVSVAVLICYLVLGLLTVKRRYILLHWKQILLVIIGSLIILLPQYLINAKYFNKHSFLAPNQGLFFTQLQYGMEIQRYETFVGDKSLYPIPQMRFVDKRGQKILEEEKKNNNLSRKYEWYLWLILQKPAYFFSMYATHFFNGLDIVYSTVYLKEIKKRSFLFSFINYSLWFFLIVLLVEVRFFKRHKEKALALFVIISPSLLAVPGAVETRFFLPFFLSLYVILFFGTSMNYVRANIGRLISRYFIFYVLFVSLWFKLSANVFRSLEYGSIYVNTL